MVSLDLSRDFEQQEGGPGGWGRRGSRASRPGGSAGTARKTGKLEPCGPGSPRRRQVSRFPGSRRVDPLARRAARPRFAYTAVDTGAAE